MTKIIMEGKDLTSMELLEIWTDDGKHLKRYGTCNRCGKCCRCCKDYVETKSGIDNMCNIQTNKPFPCVLSPISPDETQEGCSYTWEEIKE